MLRRSFALSLAVATLMVIGSIGSARAATVKVRNDSGSLGSFVLTNLGGGSYSISLTPAPLPELQRINGLTVITDADFGPTVDFDVTAGLGTHDYEVSSDPDLPKVFFGDPGGSSAFLTYLLDSGQAGSGLNKDALILSGTITGVPGPLLDVAGTTYDFSEMLFGNITFALTGSDYSAGISSMFEVINGPAGSSVSGTGAFSQSAIPEPTSVALLGIGLGGLIAFRRRFAKRAMV